MRPPKSVSIEEFRALTGVKKHAPLAPMDAEQLRKAGSIQAALRIQAAEEAKAKRDAALRRKHVDRCELRIIGKPPNYNQLLKNPWTCAKLKAEYAVPVTEAWARAGKPVIASPYKYRAHLIRPTKKGDRQNLTHGGLKAAIDTLVNLKALAGDGFDDDHGDGPHTFERADHWMLVLTIESLAPAKDF